MQNIKNKAFTLVELLVVITILAIISVVAYQNFGWAVDKAVSGRKISDVSTIETALQQYKADKNFFPPADIYSATNLWWYDSSRSANRSNTLNVEYDWQEVKSLSWTTTWGWYVKADLSWTPINIGFKWTISQKTLWKKYLTKDLYDPELWDINIQTGNKKMIDFWIWRYVYAIYKKWGNNSRWNDYNIAYTIKKDESDKYLTKISWTYDKESCYWDPSDCPETLIWSQSWSILVEWDEQIINWTIDTWNENQWIPYPVTDFSK